MRIKYALLIAGLALSFGQGALAKEALVDQVSGQGYGTAGCGLGSIVFGDKPGTIQVFAATLNGLWGNQTFGLTSGTSNCLETSGGKSASLLFIEANKVALQNDAARGNGETLENFSEILGCQDPSKLGKNLQSNYDSIFLKNNNSAQAIHDSISASIHNEKALDSSCKNAG